MALDVTEADFDAVVALNVKSTFFLSQHAARLMIAGGGGADRQPSSQAAVVALPGAGLLPGQGAVSHLTRCLAVEWGGTGSRQRGGADLHRDAGDGGGAGGRGFTADTVARIAALHRIG